MAYRSIASLTLAGGNRAHDRVAHVGADTNLKIYSVFGAQPLGEPPHSVPHPQRGIECTLWVVLVGRRTE
jgi:hypothetical protein